MKGVELPINILVIVAVAVIVLLGIVALYFAGFIGPASTINQGAAKTAGCSYVMNNPNGCQTVTPINIIFGGAGGPSRFDVNGDGTYTAADNLQALCERYYSVVPTVPADIAKDASNCRKVCGCQG